MFTRSPESIVAAVIDCWHQIKPEQGLPKRQDVSPRLLASLLPYVCLLDVVPGNPPDFRFRLMGEHLRSFYGLNVTGMLQSSFVTAAPGEQAPLRDALVQSTILREPIRIEGAAARRPAAVGNRHRPPHRSPHRVRRETILAPDPSR